MYYFTGRKLGFIVSVFIVFGSFVGNSIAVHAELSDSQTVTSSSEEPSNESKTESNRTYTYAIEKDPTCTEAGIVIFTNVDGDTYSEEIPKLQHIPDNWEITKEPTFTHTGERTKRCAFCGIVMETDPLPQKAVPVELITEIISVIALITTATIFYTTQIKKALA
ncbi:MAG: hypothetical protein J5802_13410 [Butyrivibrio sp.]|nr:hypothetical protein [Butyrivibrio sp.]